MLKTLKLKIISNGEAPSFSSAEGELDFSKIDFTRIYKSSTTRVVKENGMDYVEPIAYTEEEANKLKMAYITFRYTSTAGSQEASSSNNRSSAEVPTFKVFAPFLNSSIYIDSGNSSYFYRYYQGYLRKGKDEKHLLLKTIAALMSCLKYKLSMKNKNMKKNIYIKSISYYALPQYYVSVYL